MQPRPRPRPTAARGSRPLRGDPTATRERLVAAAAGVFNRDGFHGTDSNRLARAAGYAPGSFYKHFPDKRAIFLEAYEAWVTAEWQAVDEVLAHVAPRARSARLVDLTIRLHRRWRVFRASMRALVAIDAEARRCHRRQRARQLDLLARLRARHGLAPATREEDALLLFTLERTCDALAEGEVRDLGLSAGRVRDLLRHALDRHFAPR